MQPEQSKFRIIGACATAAALLLIAASATAADTDSLPAAKHDGAISYRSGGIGSDSSDAMKAEASRYSLAMTFWTLINNRNAYTIPTHLSIVNASGNSVLDVTPDGPYLLIDLPAGKYQVTAAAGASSKTRAVEIVAGSHKTFSFEVAQVDASR